ncbi:MAG: hypothetical protein AAGH15_28055, partial [Myxococcota bacterium]
IGAFVATAGGYAEGRSAAEALSRAVEDEVRVDPADVLFWGEGGPLRHRSALFRGVTEEGAPADLYYADVRFAAEGRDVLGVRNLTNLTRSGSADEGVPVAFGEEGAAFLTRVDGKVTALVLVDLRGEDPALTAAWSGREQLQNGIGNWQETGRREGLGRQRFAIEPPADVASLRPTERGLALRLVGGGDTTIALLPGETPDNPRLVREPAEKGRPGTITWVVDTVRDLSYVGPEPIAWLENRVFAVKDFVQRAWYRIAGSTTDEEAEIAAELGLEPAPEAVALAPEAPGESTGPDIGWPPARLELARDASPGEGEWNAIGEEFVGSYPGGPRPFYTTYLKVDPERPFARVYLVVWDARQVQLRVMTGTREPESATGATGPGRIPRDEATLRRVVAGFNGGFQSLHGEFGMMSEGKVYLPPKPWAATVAVRDDGRVAMGSWLAPPPGRRFYLEGWATRQIPDDIVEFRQNLTSVVEDGRYNPWERWYWGAAPRDATDQTFIDRSGLCLTEEGFFVYFWGESMGADQLGQAMLEARCVRGLHLDMNQRHTGFELYRTYRAEEPPPPLGRALRRSMEFDEPIHRSRGWRARGRKLVRAMTPMRFPRYLLRDVRDFFYLTLKPVLPGPALAADAEPGRDGAFDVGGLPHAGWPPAFARSAFGRGAGQRWLVRIDPARALPAPLAPPGEHRVLGRVATAPAEGSRHGLYVRPRTVGRSYAVGRPPPGARLLVAGPPLAEVSDARAALGVDGDGFWVVAERGPGGELLGPLLAAAGVTEAVALPPEGLSLAFASGAAGPDGAERAAPTDALLLVAEERPAADVLFPEVEPAP